MKNLKFLAYPLITLLSLAAAAAVHAESPTHDNTATQARAQTKTRAQVQAELMQARADGSIEVWSTSYALLALAKPEKSREEVRTEVTAARAADYAAAWYGEDSGSFELARMVPSRDATRMLARVK